MMNKKGFTVITYVFLIVLLVISVVPFYLMIINSTHSSVEILTKFNLLPGRELANNYVTMQSHVNIWRGFLNSIFIAVPYTLLVGYFGALTAYGFAKYTFRFKKVLWSLVIASMMIPSQLSLIGFYQLNLRLHLLNSYIPFIIPGIANATTVFFLHQMIQSVPSSMIEAARIDGCSEFGIFNRVVLPCVIPGIATMCIFSFVSCWNNYMGPLIIMTDNERYTMPVMIAMIKGLYLSNYGAMYLAIAISVVPILIVYIFLSKYIINGLTAGSMKG
ncbi:carbohydrate ABC transporter permease [Anaerolactibacter massiliensis]|uniref:carbohydrate ABC transporter permease n=1 Tax=Anaerolactibacter massiliensis TaxID=2044573 RepID=UPI00195AC091|nr:carbohydrate ABC transporter permease [Anaerolactibacter massiliensis]